MKRYKIYLGLILLIPSVTQAGELSSLCTELQNTPSGSHSQSLSQKLNDRTLLDKIRAALKSSAEIRDALCIISGDKKSALLEDILRLPYEALIPEVFSTIYAIRTDKNQSAIEIQANKWIKDPSSEATTLRVVGSLNLLTLLKSAPKLDFLIPHFNSQNTEIKLRSYEYFFHHYSEYSVKDRQPHLKAAIKGQPYQLRIAALEHYKSLSVQEKQSFQAEVNQCKKDSVAEVREECP
jgi:hypothetical protein